jgi:DNA polymerase elongation subunit (family B)
MTPQESSAIQHVAFDIEVLPNCFTGTFHNIERNVTAVCEVSERRNDIIKLFRILQKPDRIFVGYNCAAYDTPVLNRLMSIYNITGFNADSFKKAFLSTAYQFSKSLIGNKDMEEKEKHSHSRFFRYIDLLTLNFPFAQRVSLKELQVTMKYPNVKEMDIDWDSNIALEQIDTLIAYNINDVLSTAKLFGCSQELLQIRKHAREKYGIECDSMDAVTLGVQYVTKEYCRRMGLKSADAIKPNTRPNAFFIREVLLDNVISFKTPACQAVHNWFKNLIYNPESKNKNDFSYQLLFDNKVYSLGLGGLHGRPQPFIWKQEKDPDRIYVQTDCASYYPTTYLRHGIKPSHIGDVWFDILQKPYEEKAVCKREGRKIEEEFNKLVLNSIFGKLNDAHGPFYDPKAFMKVTCNDQLMLLMLVEDLTLNGFEIMNANTDAVECLMPRERLPEYTAICKKWEEKTLMTLEHDKMSLVAMMDCNNYIMMKENKKLKVKGRTFLLEPQLGKGYLHPIVQTAVMKYIVYNIPVEETIRGCNSIYEFLMAEKTKSNFIVEWGGVKQQKVNRFYASSSQRSPYLFKYRADNRKAEESRSAKQITGRRRSFTERTHTTAKSGKSSICMLRDSGVEILNEVDEKKPVTEYAINYNYYIVQANKIIAALNREIPADLFISQKS